MKKTKNIEAIYRLTGLQQGMLFHGLYNGSAGAYIAQFGCDIIRPDLDVFTRSWKHVMAHHTVLRSAFFHDKFSLPVQCVYKHVELPITILDYRGMTASEQRSAIAEYEQTDRKQGFNFKKAPLMRITLMRLTEDRYHMMWTWHHILFDGWSLPIILEEFLTAYKTLLAGDEMPLVEEDKYEDYIRHLESINKEQEEKYWRDYLNGVEHSTLLPFIKVQAGRTKAAGDFKRLPLQLDADTTAQVQRYAQRHRLTVNTIMQGVWSYLLHRYTGNNDIVFGVTVSGRPENLPGVERRVGLYINSLPLHSRLDPQENIAQWLARMQAEQAASRQYEHTALYDIQQWAGIEGDFFDSLLVFENYPVNRMLTPGEGRLRVEGVRINEQTNYPLTISISAAEQITVVFRYNGGLLKDEYMLRIRSHFEHVLRMIIHAASKPGDIQLLSGKEQEQLLGEFNDTVADYPGDKTVVSLFEEQVLKTPDNAAVVFGEEVLSYRQLNERVDLLADYLLGKGVQPEALIPVCIERSAEMMVAVLGILKAGAAYVPIDPAYPADRIKYILEDTGAGIVVTSKGSSERIVVDGIEKIVMDWPAGVPAFVANEEAISVARTSSDLHSFNPDGMVITTHPSDPDNLATQNHPFNADNSKSPGQDPINPDTRQHSFNPDKPVITTHPSDPDNLATQNHPFNPDNSKSPVQDPINPDTRQHPFNPDNSKIPNQDPAKTDNPVIAKHSQQSFKPDAAALRRRSQHIRPHHLAYVIYTSGSTGTPKGVMIEHGSLVNYLLNSRTSYINPEQSTGSGSFIHLPFTFDASLTAMFMPLLAGRPVVIGTRHSVEVFEDENLLKYAPYDFIKLTPAHMHLLKALMEKGIATDRLTKRLVVGGEALQPAHVQFLTDNQIDVEIINEYGPTEATVGCSTWSFRTVGDEQKIKHGISIGKPVANAQMYILSEGNELLPVGVAGEICIGGSGLARGYLNQPGLTAEKFISHPFSMEEGARIYRTGDIGRWLPDGNIEYLGRRDEQVKINGYRIELGEIEFALQQSGLVNQSAVIAKENSDGTDRLIAYIVPQHEFDREAVIAHLSGKLPSYMVPAIIVELPALPLTANGKVDRKALPDPDTKDLSTAAYVAPRNETEAKLAAIWQQVLALERVGIHDDFFRIGGHSVLAIRLVSAIRKELLIEVPLRVVFDNPTIETLAASLEASANRQVLSAVEASARPQRIPLSFSQERLWFIDRMEGSTQYHIPAVLRLKGPLNIKALKHALREIVNRHEVLRTVIREENGDPWQHILEKDTWELEFVDEGPYKPDENRLHEYIRELISKPFDLSRDHMLRATLLQLHETEYILAVVIHHIASDAWSTSIIVKELAALYRQHTTGLEADLPPLNVQYADYAVWQRNYLQGQVLEKKLSYWSNKLSDVSPLQLPTDYPRPAAQSKRGAISVFSIDAVITEQLQKLSAQYDTTLFMTLLAAFKVLLFRYSGQQDICVGTAIAGRQQQEVEGLIGFFVNTIPLRTHVSGESSFVRLLQQVRQTTLDAFEHQEVPFEKVVDKVITQRDLSRSPVFQVLFGLHNIPAAPRLDLAGVQLSREAHEHNTAQFELMFDIMETPNGLQGSVTYRTDLYTEETIERMMGHYMELLRSVVQMPSQRVAALTMLGTPERGQLLKDFNDTAAHSVNKTIVTLFEEQVLKTPGNVAVVCGERKLSYEQLNEKANQLAHYLRSRAIAAEALVPICIERSAEMMVAVLGILKAGAAYVPIDPAYPAERIKYILEDTKAGIVVTTKSCSDKVAGNAAEKMMDNPAGAFTPRGNSSPLDIIELDEEYSIINLEPKYNPLAAAALHNLAYVIYTSGSTGTPKGVMIEHGSLINYLLNSRTSYINPEQSTGSGSFIHLPFTFDASLTAMFMPLLAGRPVVIGTRHSVEVFEDENLLKYAPYDFIKLTPAHMHLLKALMEKGIATDRLTKRLVVGGEALQPAHVQFLTDNQIDVEIINEYGPTEATVGCSTWSFRTVADEQKIKHGISIGKPVANAQMYILSEGNELLPVGVAGEICIGGSGLARGYLNQPGLTAEKFISHPFSMEEGARIYRTGDIGRWLPDGNIEYLGRRDEQVKIRGYRIELGEIEAVLQQSRLVSEAAVMARDDGKGNKQLVAYVVAHGRFDREEVTGYLSRRLPEYMIPGLWMELESLPLTANGKVDRRALPDPGTQDMSTAEYIAPRNEVEAKLAAIWQEVLEVERVGIHDDFFELGGHSLLTIRVIAVVRKELQAELPITDLFDHPTIASLSLQIQKSRNAEMLPAITAQERPDRIPLSFSQERLWFIHQLEGSVQYHRPAVVKLKGELNRVALAFALQHIVNRHEVLRTVIREENGKGWQYIKDKDAWQLTVIDGAGYQEDPAGLRRYIERLISQPFDLSKDDMLRATLIKLNDEEQVLVINMHHIASDGWSTSILVKELAALYNSYLEDSPIDLPQLAVQYADYAIWQRTYLQGEVLDKKMNYWKEKLQAVAPLQLPVDFPRPAIQSTRGRVLSFNLDKTLSAQLRQLSHEQGTTLFMTMLAAFKVLLYRYSGQEDICVGTPIASRQQRELENLIGFFINTLALRTHVNGETSFKKLLQDVRNTTLQAYEHQEAPFEKIVDAVVTARDLSRSPLFQVMFMMNNTPEVPPLRLGDVQLLRQDFEHTTVQFDLVCNVTETADALHLSVTYCSDLYKEPSIVRLMTHYETLLRAIVQQPWQKVNALKMITQPEERQLVHEFNNTAAAYPKDKTVVGLFEEQAERTPDNIAVIFEKRSLTYRQLNERSTGLANYLRSKGIKEGDLIPVCIERSMEMMIAVLGIMKAGAAYVPIDPAYPLERMRYMLEDIDAGLILTSLPIQPKLPADSLEVIAMDDESSAILFDLPIFEFPAIHITPQHLAYVIYTSGSTGQPKGVMIEHGSLVHYLLNRKTNYIDKESTEGSGSFIHLPFTFDASLTAMFMPLLSGKSVVISSRRSLAVFEDENLLAHAPYDFIKLTPAHLHLLRALMDEGVNIQKLTRRLVLGGEALQPEHVQFLTDNNVDVEIINEYGPTEATVGCSTYRFRTLGDEEKIKQGISIGKPIDNTQLYIVNEANELLPVGVPGEICIGGPGLARGYLHRDDLTREQFIAHPISTEKGARAYRTGDLGRWLPDGNIEYLGRRDEQVKIRGYRIELAEVENALHQSKLVSQAAVVAREDKYGNRRLIAYVVPNDQFNKDAIVADLSARLPDYMVPGIIMEVKNIPLTNNGKVDRKALPDAEANERTVTPYEGPRNEVEIKLAAIWQELLDVEQVGIHDNFFELGGDSIIVLQVVSRARRSGYMLQPRDLFLHQTISKLAWALAERSQNGISGEQGYLSGASGLLPIQEWYFEHAGNDKSHFNQSALFEIDKSITRSVIKNAVEQLVAHHDALRFRYYQVNGRWHQEYGNYTGEVITEDLRSAPEGMLANLISQQADRHQRSLDIEKGELVRVVWMQTPDTQPANRLLVIIHHLAVDGVSWRILLEDMEMLVNGSMNGKQVQLNHKSTSYRQWYQALENYSRSNALLSQKAYWQQVVENYHPLPVDKKYAGVSRLKDRGHRIVRLSAEQTRRLVQEVPRVYHTQINDILLGALAKTLSDWSGTDKVIIGLEGHGREEIGTSIDTSRTIGWFTSLYPVLLHVPKNKGADHLIKSVKEQLRLMPDKGLGYGVLRYINKDEALHGKDCWDIVFNYLGQLDNVVGENKWLQGAKEYSGSKKSEEHPSKENLSVNGVIQSGELVLSWSYSSKHYEEKTVSKLAAAYLSNLGILINHCIEQQQMGLVYTPSDYGLGAEISYEELDSFLDEIHKGRPRREQVEGIYRLSGLQQGMLFHWLYDGRSGVYVEQFGCDLIRPNIEIFTASWKHVLERHSILRSAFYHDQFSVPVQCVYKQVELPVTILDYRNMTEAAQAAAIKEYEEADRAKGFPFKASPLMRFVLIRLDEARYRMLWTWHHILFDGWSLPILMEEFLNNYQSLISGSEVKIADVDRYEDYIRYIESRNKDEERSYWTSYMQGVEQSTLLPFVATGTERTKGLGTYQSLYLRLDPATSEKIQRYAQQQHVTVNTLMQGVWAFLLHQYTGNNDVVYGVTVSGRPGDLGNVEQRVGMYINTLPLHSTWQQDQKLTEWLQTIQREQLEGREHQYTALNDIREWTGVQGDLFDSLLVFENYPVSKTISGRKWQLQAQNVQVHERSNYPLTILIASGEQINIRFSYNEDLLDGTYIQKISSHFENVLLQAVESLETKLSDISLLTPPEELQVLSDFNATASEFPADKSIVELFEKQVAKTPQAVAVVFEEEQLTYTQLNERSNRLAHYLRSKGVKAETMVPLCMERSLEMIVAILAILKAGGAYVPIDPAYPKERIRFMLDDTAGEIVICSKESRSRLPVKENVEVITLSKQWPLINRQPSDNLSNPARPHHLAYVIYTSGSTGAPKGVMVTHGNVVSLVKGVDYVSLGRKDILLSTGSPSFDATTFEYWSMLLNGGQLVLCTENRLLDSELLKMEIETRRVNKMWFTSSWFNQLVDSDIAVFEGLETILVGGEKLSGQHIEKLRNMYPSITIINGYGPTENTTFSLTYKIEEWEIKNSIPIGRPLNNRCAYIMDAQQRLVPVGVPGEIYLGGAGVARGYLNRDELTKEKFIKDPFSKDPNARLYKTGDLGRWLPDGNIEYIGRMDEQVKIRGYRIELGEIESVMQQSGLVNQAVVIAKADQQGGKRLVAYVVVRRANGRSKFDKEALLSHMRTRLPDYMVPALLVELDSLPLTSNGKVNKKALPDPDAGDLLGAQYVAPRTEPEQRLAGIWQQLLGIKRIGVHDNFFELGGDSIKTLHVVHRAKKLGYILQPKDIFTYPTIKKLSIALAERSKSIRKSKGQAYASNGKALSIVPIQKEGNNPPFFAIPGFWLYRPLAMHLGENQPFYGFEPSPYRRVEDVAQHFITELKSVQPHGPYFLAAYCGHYPIALEMAHRLMENGDDVPMVTLFEAYGPTAILSKKSPRYINQKLRYYYNQLKEMPHKNKMKFLLSEFNKAVKLSQVVIKLDRGRTYTLRPYHGKVVLFKASIPAPGFSDDPLMGWSEDIFPNIETFTVEGDHAGILKEPNVTVLANKIKSLVEEIKSNLHVKSNGR